MFSIVDRPRLNSPNYQLLTTVISSSVDIFSINKPNGKKYIAHAVLQQRKQIKNLEEKKACFMDSRCVLL